MKKMPTIYEEKEASIRYLIKPKEVVIMDMGQEKKKRERSKLLKLERK